MLTNLNNFVEELRLAYNNILDLRKHLDNKASNMITAAAAVSSLLFGFGTFTLTKIDPTYQFLSYASITLIAAVAVTVASALISLRAFKMEKYLYVMSNSRFFRKNVLGKDLIPFNDEVIHGYMDADPNEFRKTLVYDYLACNLINNEYNNIKVKKITMAQRLLLIGIFLIPLILGMLFVNQIGMIVTRLLHLLGL